MFLVSDVLELSRVEETPDFEMHPLPIKPACEYALRSVNLMARDHQIELSFECEDDLPLVHMVQESIERAVINLLTNGIKYTPEGGKITVSARYLTDTNEIRVDVIDTGMGIPKESLEHIFDRFYRVERKVHTIKGTGLGLTIVKKIIERHGGRVAVVSILGKGSTFTFFLPTASSPTDKNNSADTTNSTQKKNSAPSIRETSSMN